MNNLAILGRTYSVRNILQRLKKGRHYTISLKDILTGYIRGEKTSAENVIHDIISNGFSEVFFVDANKSGNPKAYKIRGGVKFLTISRDDFFKTYLNRVELVLVCEDSIEAQERDVVDLLCKGFKNIFILDYALSHANLKVLMDGNFTGVVRRYDAVIPQLDYLEYHLSDVCNLKCDGCSHFSNKAVNPNMPVLEEFELSIKGLYRRFSNIKKFQFLGGEPLLNKRVSDFIKVFRKYFPATELHIVTNGLLISDISEDTVKSFRDANVIISVSQYPPTREKIDKIIDFCDQNRLSLDISAPVTEFKKRSHGKNIANYLEAYSTCSSKHCHFMRNGRIFPCTAPAIAHDLNDVSDYDVSDEDYIKCSFDIINGEESGWEILCMFLRPFKICSYCGLDVTTFKWSC